MKRPASNLSTRIAKLEAEVDSLLGLLIRAYGQFLFLRPMMVNEKLIERISLQEKGVGFGQLRDWLYWGSAGLRGAHTVALISASPFIAAGG